MEDQEVYIYKNVSIAPDITTAGQLYNLITEKKVAVMSEWLQRLRQSKKWKAKRGLKIKSFLYSFFTGNSLITPFYYVSIDILDEFIKKEYETEKDPVIKIIFKELKEEIENYKSQGYEYVLLDGQNRLFEAIKPFFEGILPSNDYNRPFVLRIDGKDIVLNNFRYTDIDLDPRVKKCFYDTRVIVAEGLDGDIRSYVDSIVDLNDGEAWTQFEATIIRPTALSYRINKDIFKDPIIQSLFGNELMSGNVKEMTSSYEVEKKGDARFISELVYGIKNECRSGLGTEEMICSMIMASEKPSIDAYFRVKNYLTFISTKFDCLKNTNLNDKQKPLSKNSLRSLVLFLDLLTNKNNTGHRDCFLKLKSLDEIKSPRALMEEFIKWHERETNKLTKPADFKDGKPIPGTYVHNVQGISSENILGRIDYISKWISENANDWLGKSWIEKNSIDYKSQELLLKEKNNYRDLYSKADSTIRLRDKLHVDHVLSRRNGGTDDIDNLVVTRAKSNLIKSDRY